MTKKCPKFYCILLKFKVESFRKKTEKPDSNWLEKKVENLTVKFRVTTCLYRFWVFLKEVLHTVFSDNI